MKAPFGKNAEKILKNDGLIKKTKTLNHDKKGVAYFLVKITS